MTVISLLVLLGCGLLLLFGCFQPGLADRNDQWARVAMTGLLLGLGIAFGMARINLWLALVTAMVVVGVMTSWPLSDVYRGDRGVVAEALVFAGGFVAVAPFMMGTMIDVLLWLLLLPGSLMGLWASISALQGAGEYRLPLWGPVALADRDGHAPLAGQGNFNHAQSVGMLSVAAATGLLWLGRHSALLVLPLLLLGVILCGEWRETGKWMSQGVMHLLSLLLALLGLTLARWGWGWSVGLWLGTLALLLWIGKPWQPKEGWIDSYRFLSWKIALHEIWWRLSAPADLVKGVASCQKQGGWLQYNFQQAMTQGAPADVLTELNSMGTNNWIQFQHMHLLHLKASGRS